MLNSPARGSWWIKLTFCGLHTLPYLSRFHFPYDVMLCAEVELFLLCNSKYTKNCLRYIRHLFSKILYCNIVSLVRESSSRLQNIQFICLLSPFSTKRMVTGGWPHAIAIYSNKSYDSQVKLAATAPAVENSFYYVFVKSFISTLSFSIILSGLHTTFLISISGRLGMSSCIFVSMF